MVHKNLIRAQYLAIKAYETVIISLMFSPISFTIKKGSFINEFRIDRSTKYCCRMHVRQIFALNSKSFSSSNYYENDGVPLGSRWVGFFADWVVLDDLWGFGRSFNGITRLYYQLFVILRIKWSNRRYHWTFFEQSEAVFDFRNIQFLNDWQYEFALKFI